MTLITSGLPYLDVNYHIMTWTISGQP